MLMMNLLLQYFHERTERTEDEDTAQRMDKMSEHAGMSNKGWTYSGDETVAEFGIEKEITIERQPEATKHNIEQLAEPGASSWLSAFPLKEQGFNLNESEFQDAINLLYEKLMKNMPSKCVCGKPYATCNELS